MHAFYLKAEDWEFSIFLKTSHALLLGNFEEWMVFLANFEECTFLQMVGVGEGWSKKWLFFVDAIDGWPLMNFPRTCSLHKTYILLACYLDCWQTASIPVKDLVFLKQNKTREILPSHSLSYLSFLAANQATFTNHDSNSKSKNYCKETPRSISTRFCAFVIHQYILQQTTILFYFWVLQSLDNDPISTSN